MDRPPPPVRNKRSQSLKKMVKEELCQSPLSPRSELSLKNIIDQVLKHLIDIIEMLLLQENSNNYIAFMKKMEEMNQESEKKMSLMIQSRLEQFKLQAVQGTPTKIKKSQTLPETLNTHLKHQRKNIAQSILSCHKSNSSQNLQGQRSAQLLKTTSQTRGFYNRMQEQIEEEHADDKTMVNSMDLHSISARISQVEQAHSKSIKDLYSNLQKKTEQAFRDIQGLTQKHLNFRLNFQEKLDTNLEAIWNVITDIRTEMAKM